MRPMLRPGLSWAWRSPTSLQLGVDDPASVVITGLPPQSGAALALMDGTRTAQAIVAAMASDGSPSDLESLIDRLVAVGAVVDGGRWPGGPEISSDARARLLPDLMAGAPADPDAWWAAMASAHVTVVGASRLGSIVGCALAAAGVGHVAIDDQRPVTSGDVTLGGFAPDDVGTRRSELIARHPEWRVMRSSTPASRRLHVVTDSVNLDDRSRALTTVGTPHLVVSCRERTGHVGPLVIPGRTACAFCVHLTRRDHDRDWPEIWRQLTWDSTPVAHSVAVALTAQLAASHVLAWLAGGQPPSMRGVIEIGATDGLSRLRPVPPHPECGCTWSDAAAS